MQRCTVRKLRNLIAHAPTRSPNSHHDRNGTQPAALARLLDTVMPDAEAEGAAGTTDGLNERDEIAPASPFLGPPCQSQLTVLLTQNGDLPAVACRLQRTPPTICTKSSTGFDRRQVLSLRGTQRLA
jgi:hypothetical protein